MRWDLEELTEDAIVLYLRGQITEDIREYAREMGLETVESIEAGMDQMADEFKEKGGELYVEAGPAPEPEEKTPPTRKTRTVRRVKQ